MRVALSKNATKEYNRLPKSEQAKIKKKLSLLEKEELFGKKLNGEFDEIYTLRAWPYRILYEINYSEQRIEVVKISHRQGVYK